MSNIPRDEQGRWTAGPNRRRSVEDRFWVKVNKAGPIPEHRPELGSCWLWIARLHRQGYGCFWPAGRMVLAHRYAYELLVGPIPQGLTLDHLCSNPPCVRPDHLEPVTQTENVLRGNGWSGRNARKTHCKNGHPLSGSNVYVQSRGRRRGCRACYRLQQNARRARKRAESS
jgi:hypothetical protein